MPSLTTSRTLGSEFADLALNEDLCDALSVSKGLSESAKERMLIIRRSLYAIQKVRNEFHPLAGRCALLYYSIMQLYKLDSMYRVSLFGFISMFRRALDAIHTDRKVNPVLHLIQLETILMQQIFRVTSRGLFVHHRLTFSFLFAVSLHISPVTVEESSYLSGADVAEFEVDDLPVSVLSDISSGTNIYTYLNLYF